MGETAINQDFHTNRNSRRGFCLGWECVSGTVEGPGFGWSEVVQHSWGPWADHCKCPCERTGIAGGAAEGLPELGAKSPRLAQRGGQLVRNRMYVGVGAASIVFRQFSYLNENEISVVKRIEKQLSGLWDFHGQQSWASPCNKTCQKKLEQAVAIPSYSSSTAPAILSERLDKVSKGFCYCYWFYMGDS